LAAIITIWIKDDDAGLKCRNWTIVEEIEAPSHPEEEQGDQDPQEMPPSFNNEENHKV